MNQTAIAMGVGRAQLTLSNHDVLTVLVVILERDANYRVFTVLKNHFTVGSVFAMLVLREYLVILLVQKEDHVLMVFVIAYRSLGTRGRDRFAELRHVLASIVVDSVGLVMSEL